jgi:hypothetical protein
MWAEGKKKGNNRKTTINHPSPRRIVLLVAVMAQLSATPKKTAAFEKEAAIDHTRYSRWKAKTQYLCGAFYEPSALF